jgi:chitinase
MKYFLLFLFFCAIQQNVTAQRKKNYYVIAYYTGDGETIKQYPLNKLTHIIYSFLGLKNDTFTFKNFRQEETVKQLVALKSQYPHLKVMVSIGGWGGCAPCSDLFASAEHRKTFAKTTVELFNKYNIDGIDLDWEYPAIAGYPGHKYTKEDRNNFTELIKELRKEMGDRYLLSFAAGGFNNFLENSIDWDVVTPLLDFINLMTYDLTSGASKETGHHTPLYNNDIQKHSTDNCVSWLLSHKVPAEKLIIGSGFYARVWEQVANNSDGLYQPGTFKRMVAYKNFDSYFSVTAEFVLHFDKKSKAPFFYSTSKKEFGTFDNKKSVCLKSKYIRRKKLGGIMFWELSLDKPQGGLVDEISKKLNGL